VIDRYFQFDFKSITVNVDDFGLDMIGGDISILIDYFSETLKGFIRQYLLGEMNDSTKGAL
jgi:hypothetical protein